MVLGRLFDMHIVCIIDSAHACLNLKLMYHAAGDTYARDKIGQSAVGALVVPGLGGSRDFRAGGTACRDCSLHAVPVAVGPKNTSRC